MVDPLTDPFQLVLVRIALAFATVVASIVMFLRALLEVAVVNRSLAPQVAARSV
jgi:hypothetical protein